MNSDIVGSFLAQGGNTAFLYGLEPTDLQSDFGCAPGNNMLFGLSEQSEPRTSAVLFIIFVGVFSLLGIVCHRLSKRRRNVKLYRIEFAQGISQSLESLSNYVLMREHYLQAV